MASDLQALFESFSLIFCGDAAAEVKDGVVIIQGKGFQDGFQFGKTFPDLRWGGFMGFGIGLVQLVQHRFATAAPVIKGMGIYIGFEPLRNVIHVGTSLPFVV